MTELEAAPPTVDDSRQRIVVRAFEEADARQWDAFVERCPEASFFHRIGWREIIDNVFHHRCHYLLAQRGDALVGMLPLAEVKSAAADRWVKPGGRSEAAE